MEPPSYEESSHHPSAQDTEEIPPPAYNTSPATPPPAYQEAVHSDPFPVLTVPSVPTVVSPPPQNSGVIVHPITRVGVTPVVNHIQVQTVAVVSQPRAVPISVQCLRDTPGLVRCPNCHHLVTSKVTYTPGTAAWCTCVFLALMGLFCGFCLIPLMIRGLQDAHHSCPRCGNQLYVYER